MFNRIICRSFGPLLVLLGMIVSPVFAADETDPVDQATGPSDVKMSDQGSTYDRSQLPQYGTGKFILPRLAAPALSTDQIGNGRTPPGIDQDEIEVGRLPESANDRITGWNWSVCQWEAPNTFSNPRYFEDRMLERHGHRRLDCLQPAISGARFFGTVAMLPYLMTVRPACECEYTLGYYRPGSQVPGFFQRPPYDRDAVIVQSAVSSGLMIALP